jgi:hypothetical protein
MTIERSYYNGPISFICDGLDENRRGCFDHTDTHCSDFGSALAKAKARGWSVKKVGSEWQHFCPDHTPTPEPRTPTQPLPESQRYWDR